MLLKYANTKMNGNGERIPMSKTERKDLKINVRHAFRGFIMGLGLLLIICGVFRREGSLSATPVATKDSTVNLQEFGRRLGNQQNSTDANLKLACQQVPATVEELPAFLEACKGLSTLRGGKPYLECLVFWHKDAYQCMDPIDDIYSTCSYFYHCSDMSQYPQIQGGVNPFGFGAIAYILGVMYTFAGLAVVCDEYFVPALEVLAERLDVSDDVAGATLMAAGGSAPELATSIMGLFVARTDVGFSTIVGSAVFNVLFVIGCCAIASKDVLVLTGWPITRDSLYYSVTLFALAIFYKYGSGTVSVTIDGETLELPPNASIEWWEALIQISLYFGYVIIMKNNQYLKTAFYSYLEKRKAKYATASVKPLANGSTGGTNGTEPEDDAAAARHRHADGDIRKINEGQPQVSFRNRRKDDARKKASTRFRVGVLDILLGKEIKIAYKLRIQAVAGVLGDVRQTFDQFDQNRNGRIDISELGAAVRMLLGFDPDEEELQKTLAEIVTDDSEESGGAKEISFDEFEKWYQESEYRVQKEMHSVFETMDTNNDGRVGEEEFKQAINSLSDATKPLTEEELAHGLHLFAGEDAEISFEEFSEWYKTTILYTHQLSQHKKEHIEAAGDDEEEEGVDLMPPDGIIPKINWFLLLPITLPLYVTVPDVRWHSGKCIKNYQKCYAVTFFLSIVWIAIYSFFMVWFITCIGDLLGLSQEVMGVTFLAAGTSVPDLISSVIVAKEGHGDMAVSSSIGSNIFDVTVGLPLPWILHHCIYGPVPLNPKGSLFFSLLLLLGMLLSIIIVIILNKFRMTKSLGYTMFAFYIVFIAIDLLRNAGVIVVNW